MRPETAALLQTILTAATLAVVAWYTIETRRMQMRVAQQAQDLARQIRLSIMPAFSVYTMNPNSPTGVYIINVGNGAAINVEVDPIELNEEKLLGAKILFERITVIRPNEEEGLETKGDWGKKENEPTDDMQKLLGLLKYLNKDKYHLMIRFQDIEGNHYVQRVQMLYRGSRIHPVETST